MIKPPTPLHLFNLCCHLIILPLISHLQLNNLRITAKQIRLHAIELVVRCQPVPMEDKTMGRYQLSIKYQNHLWYSNGKILIVWFCVNLPFSTYFHFQFLSFINEYIERINKNKPNIVSIWKEFTNNWLYLSIFKLFY